MRITEIFHSIQGESSYSGQPCVFVRTTGCNLRCVWCDTEYAFYGGRDIGVEEVLDEMDRIGHGCRLALLTGGEPLLQHGIGELARRLLQEGYTVLCETSGSLPLDRIPSGVIKIMDIKCPGSGEATSNDWHNLELLEPGQDELKFVIADRGDYDWAVEELRGRRLERFTVHFSPEFASMEPRRLAEWVLADGLPVRMQLQLHKFIWEPTARGV